MSAHVLPGFADSNSFLVSRFPTAFPVGPAYGTMAPITWAAFTALIGHRRHGEKDGPNFVPATFKREPDGKVRRLRANLVARTAIALDIETNKQTGEVPPPLVDVVAGIKSRGWTAALYTSHSHTPAAPRYRVVLPLSAEISPELPAVEVIAKQLGLLGVLDTGKIGAASLFYLPSAKPGDVEHHQAETVTGAPISAAWMQDCAGALLAARDAEREQQRDEALEAATKRREARQLQGIDPDASIIEGVRERLDLAGELVSHGYQPIGDKRYLFPGSESGIAGVYVLRGRDGIERVFSHHAADPLSAGNLPSWCRVKAIDVVDLVTILDHGGDQTAALRMLAARFGIGERDYGAKAEQPRSDTDTAADRETGERSDMLDHPDMSVLRLYRRAPPILPLEVFGPRWAAWIAHAANAAACPPDYVAAPLLSIASGLIGNARWAEAWPGWTEPPHLWTCGVGDSGSGKSPGADALVGQVLPVLEGRMSAGHPEALRDWAVSAEIDKAARETWESEVRTAQKQGLPPPMPPEAGAQSRPEAPRLRQNDVTIEKVATLLASAAPKGLMIVRDEMLGWVAGMNAYNDGGRAFWIEAYGGRSYRVERQKNPDPIDVDRLVVAASGGTQPAKLATLLREPDDGLLGRILWFWPDPVPFTKGKGAPDIAWATEALDHLRRLDLAAGNGLDASACPTLVPLDDALHGDMEAFGQEMQERQAAAGGLMQSAYAKARGLALRLSLVLTYLRWVGDGGKGPPPSCIERVGFSAAATLVADYLMPMAERLYGDAATNKEDRDAATLARWIIKERPLEVHVRTLQRVVRLPGLDNAPAIHAAAEVLLAAGWLIPFKPGGFQQRARAAYPINSKIFGYLP